MQLGSWGWPNGRIPYDQMVSVEGEWFHPEVGRRIAGAMAELRRRGGAVTITEGYRDYEGQVYQKQRWTALGQPGNAATPGTSNHGWAQAADVDSPDQLALRKEVFRQYGLLFTISNESWHCDASGTPTVPLPNFATTAAASRELLDETAKDWFDMATPQEVSALVAEQLAPIKRDIRNLIELPATQAGFRDRIDSIYMDVLGRHADPGGLVLWVNAMTNGASDDEIVASIVQSDEFKLRQIDRAYREELGRPADAGGLSSWLNFFKAGNSEAALRVALRDSDEYKQSH